MDDGPRRRRGEPGANEPVHRPRSSGGRSRPSCSPSGSRPPARSRSSSSRCRRCRRSISRPSRCRRSLPGASPEVVATTVATPLERHLGQIADVTEMTSPSTVGAVRINLQFGLDRDINGAARDVQAAINAARVDLPTSLRSNPTYKKVNPADAPILILALTSDTLRQGELYDAASTVLSQKLSQVDGVGEVVVGGSSLPAVRVELNPTALFKYGIGLEDVRAALASANAHSPKGDIEVGDRHLPDLRQRPGDRRRRIPLAHRRLSQRRAGPPDRCRRGHRRRREHPQCGPRQRQAVGAGHPLSLSPAPTSSRRSTGSMALLPELRASISPAIDVTPAVDRSTTIRASLKEVERTLVHLGDPRHPGGVPVPAQRAGDAGAERRGAGVADRHLRRDVPAGLQPRQSVADGAHRRHRLRGRRRHRGAGEHFAPHRGRHAAASRPRSRAPARSASPSCR